MAHPAIQIIYPDLDTLPEQATGQLIVGPWKAPEPDPIPEPAPVAPEPRCATCHGAPHMMRIGNLITGYSELVEVGCAEFHSIGRRR